MLSSFRHVFGLRNAFWTPSFFSEDETGDLHDMGVAAHAKVKYGTAMQCMQYLCAEAGYVDDLSLPITAVKLTVL